MSTRLLLRIARTQLGQLCVGVDLGQLVAGIAVNRDLGHLNFQVLAGPLFLIASFRLSPYDSSPPAGRLR
jgi:hypothetical protein